MKFNVIATKPFERKLKKLAKKYSSLKNDLSLIIESLEENPNIGQSLGKGCYKIRMTINSKGKGKSSGARLVTCVKVYKNAVFLLDIYDKSEKETISHKELKFLINLLSNK